jgi:hypothetical protein
MKKDKNKTAEFEEKVQDYLEEIDENFNPLAGDEDEVIDRVFGYFYGAPAEEDTFFRDHDKELLRNSIIVVKSLKKDEATIDDLLDVISNCDSDGRKLVTEFAKLKSESKIITKRNTDIVNYFLTDYYSDNSLSYVHTIDIRYNISKTVTSERERKKFIYACQLSVPKRNLRKAIVDRIYRMSTDELVDLADKINLF